MTENTTLDKSQLPPEMSVLWKYGDFIAQKKGGRRVVNFYMEGFFIEAYYSPDYKSIVKVKATEPRNIYFYLNKAINTTYSLVLNYFPFI